MKFSNKVYDVLKWVAIVGFPAVEALYFAISQLWGLPYTEQVVGTLAAIGTCLGAMLAVSSKNYNNEVYTFNVPVEKLEDVGKVTFILPENKEED